jgi:hypothetical protein
MPVTLSWQARTVQLRGSRGGRRGVEPLHAARTQRAVQVAGAAQPQSVEIIQTVSTTSPPSISQSTTERF